MDKYGVRIQSQNVRPTVNDYEDSGTKIWRRTPVSKWVEEETLTEMEIEMEAGKQKQRPAIMGKFQDFFRRGGGGGLDRRELGGLRNNLGKKREKTLGVNEVRGALGGH
ncbi:hypothetical protein Fot_19148 [Forsythia ovata]|uniref:Uncharacterized protein n=1 Tax=Forsythia ovata TaxID=205694 RepID=A0ABD1VKM1_9LAMI